MQIEIDFEVYKALTALRKHERHGYNDVIRELLELDPLIHPDSVVGRMSKASAEIASAFTSAPSTSGFSSRGLFLPDGTLLRAVYKNALYQAQIVEGRWIDEHGQEHSSPSGAANHITKTTVNGWRFWEAMRPSDLEWRRLDKFA
jgi:hypothetical protein